MAAFMFERTLKSLGFRFCVPCSIEMMHEAYAPCDPPICDVTDHFAVLLTYLRCYTECCGGHYHFNKDYSILWLYEYNQYFPMIYLMDTGY